MPNFAELWPHNNPGMGRKKAVGPEYYQAAMQHHGLSGHLPQPENFTTCGKQPIEIAQYNSPIEVTFYTLTRSGAVSSFKGPIIRVNYFKGV